MVVLSGTVVEIGPGNALLSLEPAPTMAGLPTVGERVVMKVLLPVATESAAQKCLQARATVERATQLADGSQLVAFKFRRANFKNYLDGVWEKVKPASRWTM
jgi:hypothetical protein